MNFVIRDNNRESQFELLRIVAMLMIVLHHVIVHGVPLYLSFKIATVVNSDLQLNEIMWLQLADCFLIYGVNLFILISGYFGIKSSLQKFISLSLLLILFNLIDVGICFACGQDFSWSRLGYSFLPLSHPHSWFMTNYLYLLLLAPIINAFAKHSSRREMQYVLLAFTLLMCYLGFFQQISPFSNGYNIWNFVFLYLIGHYIRSYSQAPVSRCVSSLGFVIVSLLSFAIIAWMILYPVQAFAHCRYTPIDILYYNNPIIIAGSVFVFLLFKSFKFKSKYINFVAGSMLSVYLLQEGAHLYFSPQLYALLGQLYHRSSPVVFILYVAVYVVLLFGAALVVDKALKYIIRLIFKVFPKSIRNFPY
jgi:hypothetical protein